MRVFLDYILGIAVLLLVIPSQAAAIGFVNSWPLYFVAPTSPAPGSYSGAVSAIRVKSSGTDGTFQSDLRGALFMSDLLGENMGDQIFPKVTITIVLAPQAIIPQKFTLAMDLFINGKFCYLTSKISCMSSNGWMSGIDRLKETSGKLRFTIDTKKFPIKELPNEERGIEYVLSKEALDSLKGQHANIQRAVQQWKFQGLNEQGGEIFSALRAAPFGWSRTREGLEKEKCTTSATPRSVFAEPGMELIEETAKSLNLSVDFLRYAGTWVEQQENTENGSSYLSLLNDIREVPGLDEKTTFVADKLLWDIARTVDLLSLKFSPPSDRKLGQQEFAALLTEVAIKRVCRQSELRGYPMEEVKDAIRDRVRIMQAVSARKRGLNLKLELRDILEKAERYTPAGTSYDLGIAFLRYSNEGLILLADKVSALIEHNWITLLKNAGKPESLINEPGFAEVLGLVRYHRVLDSIRWFEECLSDAQCAGKEAVLGSSAPRSLIRWFLPAPVYAAPRVTELPTKLVKGIVKEALERIYMTGQLSYWTNLSPKELVPLLVESKGVVSTSKTGELITRVVFRVEIPGVGQRGAKLKLLFDWVNRYRSGPTLEVYVAEELTVSRSIRLLPAAKLSRLRYLPIMGSLTLRFLGPIATAYALYEDWPTIYDVLFKKVHLSAEAKKLFIKDAYFRDYTIFPWVNLEGVVVDNVSVDGVLTIQDIPKLTELVLSRVNRGGIPRIVFANLASNPAGNKLRIDMTNNLWEILPSMDGLLGQLPTNATVEVHLGGNNFRTAAPVVDALLKSTGPLSSRGANVSIVLDSSHSDIQKNWFCDEKSEVLSDTNNPERIYDARATQRWKLYSAKTAVDTKRALQNPRLAPIELYCGNGDPNRMLRVCVEKKLDITIRSRQQLTAYDLWDAACTGAVILQYAGATTDVQIAREKFFRSSVVAQEGSTRP